MKIVGHRVSEGVRGGCGKIITHRIKAILGHEFLKCCG